jgi:secondary thiamine-phosphate synthase enzyme
VSLGPALEGGCRTFRKTLHVQTKRKFDVIKVTEVVEGAVRESGIREGFALVFIPHATAAVILNEYEPRIVEDYITWIKRVIPPGGGWKHDEIDSNAHAHLASAFIGQSRVLPVSEGLLVRGTWQEVLLLEFDGPRSRTLVVEVVGCG